MTPKFWVVDDDGYHDDEVSASCILFNAISAQTVVARSTVNLKGSWYAPMYGSHSSLDVWVYVIYFNHAGFPQG